MLTDAFGRATTDLRISLTDRCNFKCVFCHNEGQGEVHGPGDPAPGEMSLDHVLHIARIACDNDEAIVVYLAYWRHPGRSSCIPSLPLGTTVRSTPVPPSLSW